MILRRMKLSIMTMSTVTAETPPLHSARCRSAECHSPKCRGAMPHTLTSLRWSEISWLLACQKSVLFQCEMQHWKSDKWIIKNYCKAEVSAQRHTTFGGVNKLERSTLTKNASSSNICEKYKAFWSGATCTLPLSVGSLLCHEYTY